MLCAVIQACACALGVFVCQRGSDLVRYTLQCVVLSEGHTLYFGAPSRALDWFSGSLGYTYNQGRDGSVSDWLMDLVSVGFGKPKDWAGR